ncbi:hypothetical protein SporoP37_02450 [Sporosarcina sp. P37]|nr:hypothetical protein SporoP37_02450 [Sporosarcina sp. P37]PID18713.1 hypothetical protein CSV62_06300 [Sporosarcina sp. P35]
MIDILKGGLFRVPFSDSLLVFLLNAWSEVRTTRRKQAFDLFFVTLFQPVFNILLLREIATNVDLTGFKK